ncbi:MAG: glycosyltransferase family 1 protein [Anaerolineales bacterium]
MITLAIDATALPPNPVGAGQYTIHLIRALPHLAGDARFLVYAQPHGRDLIGLPQSDALHFVRVSPMSPARRLLWEQTVFAALLRRSGADVLLSPHYTMPLVKPLPQVVVFHDMTFFLFPHLHTFSKRHFFRWMIRQSARRADHLLAVSESTRQDAIHLAGAPPEKISTTPLGVTPDFHPITDAGRLEAVRARYGLPARFVLFVGLLEPRKNLPGLLRAFQRVASACPEVSLVVVGRKGWMYEQALHLVTGLGLRERVHFTGYVAQDDLPVVYNLAEVVAYPSLYEGFGLPVLEAMACGKPVVTANRSSMPEIASEAAVLTSPEDTDALAEALIGLLRHPEARTRLGAAARQRAGTFTWQRTARLTLDACRRVKEG